MKVSAFWDEELELQDTLALLRQLAIGHARKGGNVGLQLVALLEQGNYEGLIAFSLDLNAPNWDTTELYHCRQALGFFTKLEDLDIGIDKEAVAREKFFAAESLCKRSNELFKALLDGKACLPARDMRRLLFARRKIASVLGRCPRIGELKLGFGPGATTSVKKKEACPQNKLAARPQCSTNLHMSGLLPELLRELPHWSQEHLGPKGWTAEVVSTSEAFGTSDPRCYEEWVVTQHVLVDVVPAKLSFVPKNAKTKRATCTEPSLNTVLQKGIGTWMVHLLKRAGIDIKDQTLNAEFAWLGSVLGGIATLDLDSASDTICYWLVKFLLPAEWFTLLNAARSTMVRITGHGIYRQEKFCSMGNGFTFPLETLIFWALTAACCEGRLSEISVYGDDIVCPSEFTSDVRDLFTLSGFVISTTKSFSEGPFRESCGRDYYNGVDVRPFNQKGLVSAATLFTLHNFYYRRGLWDEARSVKSYIPLSIRLTGPDGYGDGHLLSETYHRRLPHKLREKGYSGYQFSTFRFCPTLKEPRYSGDHVTPLYHVYSRGKEDLLPTMEDFDDVAYSSPVHIEGGRPWWPLSGVTGYEKTEIYVLQ